MLNNNIKQIKNDDLFKNKIIMNIFNNLNKQQDRFNTAFNNSNIHKRNDNTLEHPTVNNFQEMYGRNNKNPGVNISNQLDPNNSNQIDTNIPNNLEMNTLDKDTNNSDKIEKYSNTRIKSDKQESNLNNKQESNYNNKLESNYNNKLESNLNNKQESSNYTKIINPLIINNSNQIEAFNDDFDAIDSAGYSYL